MIRPLLSLVIALWVLCVAYNAARRAPVLRPVRRLRPLRVVTIGPLVLAVGVLR
jgi:hypothetical protein